MARIVVIGSVAQDAVFALRQPLRANAHLEAEARGERIGGGAAGTGLPLAYAGHAVRLVSPLGTDAAGDALLAELAAGGIDTSTLSRVAGSSTRSLVLLDPDGERTVVNLHRCREPEPPACLGEIAADAIYVRSRDPDLAPLLAARLGDALLAAHVPPVAEGARPSHVLVGSEADLPAEALAAPWAFGRRVAGEALRWFVVTRGASGAEAFSATERLHAPAPPAAVVDSTGAGDALAAGLLHGLLSGASMREALQTAVAWGAAKVAIAGSVLTRDAVSRLLAARRATV
jgi:sugar/nucleoside kinase (ribokinase family)